VIKRPAYQSIRKTQRVAKSLLRVGPASTGGLAPAKTLRRSSAGMAAKKMFSPRAFENLLGDDYDEFKLGISFRIQTGQVVMQFSDHVERIRMSGAGARKLAALLIENANELDRLGSEGKSR
jgi:hypothetical protein